ncbi:aminoacyl-tRNA hydrolase [Longirhabdus pacifica]|uniref:aminoacyl-tRNA hydrolase n=1 Tax=Longirhabdus pacifica TaxID=2305227 RepID=UPI001008F124|nr:aminoacyl-tRNA hydrolase [Longirhabdus pacifica]
MKLIVGLGNPGKKYDKSKHNTGFAVMDHVANNWGIKLSKSKFHAELGMGEWNGVKVAIMKPMLYYNCSGESVRAFMDFYKLEPHDMIVVYDDLDTDIGKIRMRFKGSAGGNNGMKSIIQHLGTDHIKRIRVGISRPAHKEQVTDYVLSPFAKTDRLVFEDTMDKVNQALESFLIEPFETVMGKFNG